MLPESVRQSLRGKELLDFGLSVQDDTFEFAARHCVLPTPLTLAYALAMAASGKVSRVLLAGFDGYPTGDPRLEEVDRMLVGFQGAPGVPPLVAITPSCYHLASQSVYSIV